MNKKNTQFPTRGEQKILNLLLKSDSPLGSEEIAKRVGLKRMSTVILIERLRNKGFQIETLPKQFVIKRSKSAH